MASIKAIATASMQALAIASIPALAMFSAQALATAPAQVLWHLPLHRFCPQHKLLAIALVQAPRITEFWKQAPPTTPTRIKQEALLSNTADCFATENPCLCTLVEQSLSYRRFRSGDPGSGADLGGTPGTRAPPCEGKCKQIGTEMYLSSLDLVT